MSNLKFVPEIYFANIDLTKRFYIDVFGFKMT